MGLLDGLLGLLLIVSQWTIPENSLRLAQVSQMGIGIMIMIIIAVVIVIIIPGLTLWQSNMAMENPLFIYNICFFSFSSYKPSFLGDFPLLRLITSG